MKKINSLMLSALTATLLVGCGGGGSSSSSTGATPTPTSTTVPVTKGPLLMANAIDSSSPAKTGTQIDGTNKYTFTGEITYPITVTGGYVDVNNNGIIDIGDYEFTGKLSSYSTVVTPITTYLGDTSKPEGEAKLKALKTLAGTNVTNDDLLKKDPIETNKEVLALLNTVYETYNVLMDDDLTNDDISAIQSTDLSSKFDSYKRAINQSSETDLSKILVVVEEELKNNKAPEKVLSALDAKKINFNKKSVVGKKLVNGQETYFFRENDVVLADTNPDFTRILSYESSEVGTLKLKFPSDYNPTYYDLIAITESGFTVAYYQGSLMEPQTVTSTTLETYNQTELDEALSDVEFNLTISMISGKEIDISDNTVEAGIQFYRDGKYTEGWKEIGKDSVTCEGTWKLNENLKGVVDITSTCTDKNIQETYMLIFNQEPKKDLTFKYWNSSEENGEETIKSIIDIDTQTTIPTESTTTSFVSGKRLDFNNAQSYGKFFADSSYVESGLELDESTGYYVSYNCSGLWKDLGNNKIGVTCQDNGTTEIPDGVIDSNSNEITFQFSSNNPTSKDKITVTEYSKSEEVTIDSFNYMNINVIDSMISGKTITLNDGITYTFNADKTFTTSETGVTPNKWETSAFLNIYYDDESMKTLVFTETPAVGVIVLENSATNNFSSEVKTITSIH